MASPAEILERLSPKLVTGLRAPSSLRPLSIGWPPFDEALPDGGLPRGAVVELAVMAGASLATSIGLSACRAAQREALGQGGRPPWCAFLDPSGTLYAPGVRQAGVLLERLLVVRPPVDGLGRTALRLVESRAFSAVVVDMVGVPGASLGVDLGAWTRIVRRLSMAVEGTGTVALLLTDGEARRPLPLPVALRIELGRCTKDRLSLRVAKDRRGRLGGPRSIARGRSRQPAHARKVS